MWVDSWWPAVNSLISTAAAAVKKRGFTICEKIEERTKTLGTKETSLVSDLEGGKDGRCGRLDE